MAKYSETKIGKVSNLRWAYVSSVKLGYPVEQRDYLMKILDIVTKGTRFQEHIDAIKSAKQVKRRKFKNKSKVST